MVSQGYGGNITWIPYEGTYEHKHTWDEGVVTKDPTATEQGEKTYTCRGCGETRTEAIAVLSNPFTDLVENSSYYNAVLWAVDQGITKGTTATEFSPKADCTRAQIITFLWRYAGEPEPPLCKGRWAAHRRLGGIVQLSVPYN